MRALTIMAAAVLAACAGQAGAEGGKLKITPEVWAGYQQYLQAIGSTGRGFYAVSEDGRAGSGVGCASGCNVDAKAQQRAKNDCSRASGGQDCVLFAKGKDIVVEYEVGE